MERDNKCFRFLKQHLIVMLLIVYDIITVNGAYFLTLWFRYDCNYTEIPHNFFYAWLKFVPIYAVICVAVFLVFHLHKSIWRFASYKELERILLSNVITSVLHAMLITLIFEKMPISYYLISPLLQFAFTALIRFAYRFVRLEKERYNSKNETKMLHLPF